MKRTPITDVWGFLTEPAWYTAAFWALIVASVVIAARVWIRHPEQRRLSCLADWLLRFFVGACWCSSRWWKLPPWYTDDHAAPFGETGCRSG